MTASVIGALRINLSADSAEFKRALTDAERMAERFGKALGSALRTGAVAVAAGAAAATTALVALTKSSMDTISAQVDLARRVGGSVAAIQTLQETAKLAGASQEALAKALGTLNARLGEAAREGAGPAYEALQRLGLSAKELSAMDADVRVKALSDRMAELGFTSQQYADTLKQLGIRQQEITNLFMEGSGAINETRAELKAWGVLLSDVDAAKVEMAGDAWDKMGTILTGVGNQLAVRLSPLIQEVADYIGDAAKEAGGFGSTIDAAVSKAVHIWGFLNQSVYDFRINLDESIAEILNLWDAIAGAPANILAKVFGGEAEDYGFKPINEAFGTLKDTLAKPPTSEEWDAWLADIRMKADEAAKSLLNSTGSTGVGEEGESGPTEAEITAQEKYREQLAQKLATLQESLLTEREAEMASYEQRLLDLEDFYARGMITSQEYNDLLVRNKEEHAAKLKAIDDDVADNQERNAAKQRAVMFSIADNISSALGSLFGDSKAWAIAEAIINTATAITKALAIYGPTPQGFAAAAAGAAAGAAQLMAIRRTSSKGGGGGAAAVSSGGSSAGGGSTQPAPQAAPGQTLFINGLTNDQLLSGGMVREIAAKLIEFQRDGGKVVLGPA